MAIILWLVAVVLVVYGVIRIVRGDLLIGIALIVLGLLVGPGGVSIFDANWGDDDDVRPAATATLRT